MSDPLVITVALLLVLAIGFTLSQRYHGELKHLRRRQAQLAREREVETQHRAQVEAQFEALGLAVLEVLVVVDRELRVIYATPGARALFGSGKQALGRSLIEFTRSVDLDQLAIDALAADEAPGRFRDELDRVISIANRPFRARAAAFDGGAVLALSDVSELQRLGRARRDFVANISHELRTPLTSIRLLLETLLADSPRDPEETTGLLRKIQVEVEVLQQMAQELLDLSQIESGRTPVRLVPTPVTQLISGAVERLAPQAARKQQRVRVDSVPELAVLADAELISRALGNLLHNAIKFTPAQGQIWVRASASDGDVVIEVADTGPGILPEDLPRVFERFFRSDRSRTGGGTGLGLAIAKHVVEAHGGRIWVESEGRPGRGATFRFTLPASDRPPL
ncbi:MAG TPA: ATP-binding protein [Anaerolineae bacterium]|nr:ATP-binding protein [Anaerolineae bacterium]